MSVQPHAAAQRYVMLINLSASDKDHRRFVTADVFTDRRYAGNPLAVILAAQGLTATQMQAVAREFNYVETTFVLPPEGPAHTARVRISLRRSDEWPCAR